MNRPIRIGDIALIRIGKNVTKYPILEITSNGIRIGPTALVIPDGVNWKVKGMIQPHMVEWISFSEAIPSQVFKSLEKFAVYSPTYEHSKILKLSNNITLGDKLGEGSFGVVYKVDGASYAVKVFRESDFSESILEIAALKRLSHANIVEIIDVVSIRVDEIGIVMTLAVSNLSQIMRNNTFTMKELDKITYQIICGISHMHSQHIIHRDLKLQNILFYSIDDIRISDFGSIQPFACEPETTWTNHVYADVYRAPEIILGGVGRYTMSADVWALACLIWEIYDGTHRYLFNDIQIINPNSMMSKISPSAIYNILGTPTPEWKDLRLMKAYNTPTKAPNVILPNRSRINDSLPNDSLRAMINSVLIYNASDRPTAYDLLRNPYFDYVRVPMNESAPTQCSESHTTRDMRVEPYFNELSSIRPNMRSELLHWLLINADDQKLSIKTYLLAVSIIDRATYILNPDSSKYQQLGSAALTIADMICNHDSFNDPIVIYIGEKLEDGTYDVAGFDAIKSKILHALNYDLLTTVSYDHHQDSITLGIKGTALELVNIFLQLFTMYDNIIFVLFPREQYRLACGLVMLLYKYRVNNSELETTCKLLARTYTTHIINGLNKTKKMEPKPKHMKDYDFDKIIETLETYRQ